MAKTNALAYFVASASTKKKKFYNIVTRPSRRTENGAF
jgi:hypothetical protein